jgi:hypothetical protein
MNTGSRHSYVQGVFTRVRLLAVLSCCVSVLAHGAGDPHKRVGRNYELCGRYFAEQAGGRADHLWLGKPRDVSAFYRVYGKSLQVRERGMADLHSPFAMMFSEELPWAFYEDPPSYGPQGSMNILVMRSGPNGEGLPKTFYGLSQPGHLEYYPTAKAVEKLETALDRVYAAYEEKGRLDAAGIALSRRQDREYAHRTIHFLGGIAHDFLSHAQILTSSSRKDPLILEDHIGPIEREEGKLYAEFGRLNIVDAMALSYAPSRNLDLKDTKTLLRLQLWARVFNHLAWDIRPHRVVMLPNTAVREIFLKQKLIEFSSEPVAGHPGEWLVTMTPEQIRKSEENLMREILIWKLRSLKERGVDYDGSGFSFNKYVERNERNVLLRLGLVRLHPGPLTQDEGWTDNPKTVYMKGWEREGGAFFMVPEADYYKKINVNLKLEHAEAMKALRLLESQRP